jgi:hypothetical protein
MEENLTLVPKFSESIFERGPTRLFCTEESCMARYAIPGRPMTSRKKKTSIL